MTYDNTDERGEDAVARQRGGSEPGHLPECHLTLEPMLSAQDWCICPALRACEARVRTRRVNKAEYRQAYRDGKNDALDAARDAVAAMPQAITVDKKDALAAIDALKATP